MRMLVAALLVALNGCGSCADEVPILAADAATVSDASEAGAAPPPSLSPWPEEFGSTADLWRRAPADATVGVVVADGAVGPLLDALSHVRRLMERFAPSREALGRWRRAASELLGLDVFEGDALARAGIDRRGALALFFDPEARVLMAVLPVSDPRAFAEHAGARQTGEGTVQLPDGRRCRSVAGRYVCVRGKHATAISGAPDGGGRLGERALAGGRSGKRAAIEVVGDGRRTRAVGRFLRELGLPYARAGWLDLSVDLSPGRAEINGTVEGRPVSRLAVGIVGRRASTGLSAGAAGAVRLVMAPETLVELLGAKGKGGQPLRVGNRDLRREFFDQLDGEIEVIARGDGVFAGELRAHLRDPSRAARALPTLCKTLAAAWKVRLFHPENGRCRGVLDPATLPYGAALSEHWAVDRVKLLVAVDEARSALLVRFGDTYGDGAAKQEADAQGATQTGGAGVAGPSAPWIDDPSWHWVFWGRSFDPLATLGSNRRERLHEHLERALPDAGRERMRALRWLLADVAELALVARVEERGVAFRALVDGVAGDPPAVYRRYRSAVEASVAGDQASYRSELRAAAARAPNSRTAAQWRLVEAEMPAFALSYLVSSFFFSKSPKVPRLWDFPPPI